MKSLAPSLLSRVWRCEFPLLLKLSYNRIFCELQQQLFGAGVLKGDGSFGILSRAFNTDDSTDAETLMLDDVALLETNVANG